MSAYYRNVQNVVVKLQGESDLAVMINCHFDSEAGSYGAGRVELNPDFSSENDGNSENFCYFSENLRHFLRIVLRAGDDGVNCCTMLEILRVMAKSGNRNAFSTIFLFNGNEEGNLEGLQASHGFITQHKWAKDVKAFINLEAQGIGGRELLFRSGPKHDWLIRKYRQSVKKPFGQVFAEEMFETNVLKSGTDFEAFRDAGNIPGLDLSYCSGGWKYHTKFDHIRYVDLESIQNTGNNVLDLVKLMSNSEEIRNPPEGTAAVYFDLWGLLFVTYTASVGKAINITISVLAVVIPFLVQTKFKLRNCGQVLTQTLISFVTFVIGVIVAMLACYLMGIIINKTDNAMFWFNSTILSLGVYSSLALTILLAAYHALSLLTEKFQGKLPKDRKYQERSKLQAQLNGINLFWAVITIAATCLGLRFVYIAMVVLCFSLITNVMIYILSLVLPATRETLEKSFQKPEIISFLLGIHSWIFVHFLGHTFSLLWTAYTILILWRIFIPISEKNYKSNPEAIISLLCGFIPILTLSYFVSFQSFYLKLFSFYIKFLHRFH